MDGIADKCIAVDEFGSSCGMVNFAGEELRKRDGTKVLFMCLSFGSEGGREKVNQRGIGNQYRMRA